MLNKRSVLKSLKCGSKVVSNVFSPVLTPFFLTLIVLFGNTSFAYFTVSVKLRMLFIVVLSTIILPLLVIPMLRMLNIIPSYKFNLRQDRVTPLLIMAICYLMAMMYVVEGMGVAIMTRLFLTMSVLASVLTTITFIWKISIHSACTASIAAFVYMIMFIGLGNLESIFVLSVLVCGVVSGARIYMKCNTFYQVISGAVIGAVVTVLTLLI